jgi:hypothetical protein
VPGDVGDSPVLVVNKHNAYVLYYGETTLVSAFVVENF